VKSEKVSFSYDNENYVLKDVSFELHQGETIAIVGATGSGKTTTVNLINRFYDIQKGHIYVDGRDIRDYDLKNLRSHIGNVLQDVFLFSGTIMENITLRNRNMTREDVVEAAKTCGIHDFIMRLPGNYDFDVKERGGTLSMGQRQLVAFIRTLVYNPSILILDEATSSIDRESEMLIQNAISKLVTNRTSIIIAHRLSTIRQADRILVFDQGEIKEQGTHEELLEHNGRYKRLHDMQFKKTEEVVE
jgi:ATP-binding cassette subfamily B protein